MVTSSSNIYMFLIHSISLSVKQNKVLFNGPWSISKSFSLLSLNRSTRNRNMDVILPSTVFLQLSRSIKNLPESTWSIVISSFINLNGSLLRIIIFFCCLTFFWHFSIIQFCVLFFCFFYKKELILRNLSIHWRYDMTI